MSNATKILTHLSPELLVEIRPLAHKWRAAEKINYKVRCVSIELPRELPNQRGPIRFRRVTSEAYNCAVSEAVVVAIRIEDALK